MVEQFRGAVLDRVCHSQAGQEAVYLRALLRGFNLRQVGATGSIMMSKNPANRERTQHVDTRVHYLRELVLAGGAGSKQASLDGSRPPRTS